MRNLSKVTVAASIAIAAAFTPAIAYAHTDIVNVNPAPGSTIPGGDYFDIDIEFSEDLMQTPDSSGSEILLTSDVTGDDLLLGCVRVDGPHLYGRTYIGPGQAGPATLTWRTVAEDGHPISESYTVELGETDMMLSDTVGFCPPALNYAPGTNLGGTMDDPTVAEMKATDAVAEQPTDNLGGYVGLGFGILIIVVFSVLGGLKAKKAQDNSFKKKTK